jgi:sulfur carrier protein
VNVLVNGVARDVPPGTTVADLVAALTGGADGVAVARNEQVVPRGAWGGTPLAEGDRVEVLTAVQGG